MVQTEKDSLVVLAVVRAIFGFNSLTLNPKPPRPQ